MNCERCQADVEAGENLCGFCECDDRNAARMSLVPSEWLWRFAVEWKIEDLWVGIFWKRSREVLPSGAPTYAMPVYYRLDVWVCLLPCVPFHLVVWRSMNRPN